MLRAVIRILGIVFIIGAVGSALVFILTFIEDLREIWEDDEPKGSKGVNKRK